MIKVYLCGPINMCTDAEANDWRQWVRDNLEAPSDQFETIDPMIRDYRGVEEKAYREIVDLDKVDVRRTDIVLANCTKASAGTSMEIFYAWTLGKIVVSIADPKQVSPWVRYHSTTVVPTLEEAIEWINGTAVTVL